VFGWQTGGFYPAPPHNRKNVICQCWQQAQIMEKHNLSTFSKVSEIISALAVVISLIYVGVQVNQNTKATQAAIRQSIADNDIDYLKTYLDNSIVAVASYKYDSEIGLSTLEMNQLVSQQHVAFRLFENAFYQFEQELLEPETWARYRVIINDLLTNSTPAKKMWINKNKQFTQSFQEEIFQLLKDNNLAIEYDAKSVDSLNENN